MKFDPTITLGTIINLIGMILGIAIIWGRFRALETKVDAMWRWFERRMNGGDYGE